MRKGEKEKVTEGRHRIGRDRKEVDMSYLLFTLWTFWK